MEALYAKLYSKYEALKKKRISELDEINKDQEAKFLNYVSVAEELIQHLNNENNKLKAQISELKSEVTSIRSTKDEESARYQKLLMEENQKNKMLVDEVERLQQQLFSNSKDDKNNKHQNMIETVHATNGEETSGSMRRTKRKRSQEERTEIEVVTTPDGSNQYDSLRMTRKRSREARTEIEGATAPGPSGQNNLLVRELAEGSYRGTVSSAYLENVQQPICCRRTVERSAEGILNESGPANCQFQALAEYLLGMKFSTINQSEGICISALHQSSGYSFILAWVKKDAEEEPELLYRVSTLGTFERVAPEWMKSVLMFSTSMCPIFFERVARVIKMHH